MRSTTLKILVLALVMQFGCGGKQEGSPAVSESKTTEEESQAALEVRTAPMYVPSRGGGGGGSRSTTTYQQVSLAGVSLDQAIAQASSRKVIREAELVLETALPIEAQAKIASIAETSGGFITSSEFKQSAGGASKPTENVVVVVRFPAGSFASVLSAIRDVGDRVVQERVTGQDVTEEYVDLDARIRTQKALEAQFLQIMRQARKVSDALEVQEQLAEVRNEIERLEGRRRFLDDRAGLSTIRVTLQTPAPVVATTASGFTHEMRDALGDGVDTAIDIVVGIVRLIIILIPIGLFILLPVGLVVRTFWRRMNWAQTTDPAVTDK